MQWIESDVGGCLFPIGLADFVSAATGVQTCHFDHVDRIDVKYTPVFKFSRVILVTCSAIPSLPGGGGYLKNFWVGM